MLSVFQWKKRKVNKPTLLTEEEAADLLSDGSAYIGYWGMVLESASEGEGADFRVNEITISEHDSNKIFTVNIQAVREAAYRVVNEKLANSDVIRDIASGDYDAVSADVVIQVAALGEVIYG